MAGVLVMAAVCTRGHSAMIGLRHLSMLLVPALFRITRLNRCGGCRAMMVMMVFHVALTLWLGRGCAQWPAGATIDKVKDQKQQDQAEDAQ